MGVAMTATISKTASLRPGWRALIDQFVADASAIDDAGEIEIVAARDVYGRLEFDIRFVNRVRSHAEDLVYRRRIEVMGRSAHVCVECGATGLRYDWSDRTFAPLCPTHAREEVAAASLHQYRYDDWRLTPDFAIVDAAGNPFSPAALAERDAAAARAAPNLLYENERESDWLAARWVSR
jgi:hypothetical protein